MNLQNSLISFLALSLTSVFAVSGTVTQTKSNKVLVDFANESVQVGDRFVLISAQNKKIAIIQINKVQKGKAIGDVTKGTAVVGATTQALKTAPSGGGSVAAEQKTVMAAPVRTDLIQLGFHIKYMMNSMSTKQEDLSITPQKETVTMKGSDIGIGASVDYPFYDWLKASGYAGYETLNIAGTAQFNSCNGQTSTDCNVKISYLNMSGLAKFDILQSTINVWLGVGGAVKYPISKKSTALTEDNIQAAQSIMLAAGLNYHLSNKSYIPVSFEYHKSLNTSDTVPTVDQMNLLLGYGIKF